MAKTQFLDWDTTASSNTDVGGIGILGTNAVSNFDDALRTIMAQLRSGVDGKVVYAAKSGNYTAVLNDNNGYMRFTAAATLSLTAVATLGANWNLFVQADGGDVLVDPNGSETINGATTLNIRNGESAIIISTGAVFFARINPAMPAYASKSGNYTGVASDNGATHRYTASATLSLTAAATLGSGWTYNIIADGGAVTIDPNASETINGATTLTVPQYATARLICDGSNFFTVIAPLKMQALRDESLSGVSSYDVTGLSAFRKLRISGHIYPSVDAAISLRTSSNNGSSYDSGATDYGYQSVHGSNTSASAANGNTTAIPLSLTQNVKSGVNDGLTFDIMIENFNKASYMRGILNDAHIRDDGTLWAGNLLIRRNQATARDAFRILPASGTLSGVITVEGWRG